MKIKKAGVAVAGQSGTCSVVTVDLRGDESIGLNRIPCRWEVRRAAGRHERFSVIPDRTRLSLLLRRTYVDASTSKVKENERLSFWWRRGDQREDAKEKLPLVSIGSRQAEIPILMNLGTFEWYGLNRPDLLGSFTRDKGCFPKAIRLCMIHSCFSFSFIMGFYYFKYLSITIGLCITEIHTSTTNLTKKKINTNYK
jgi:hypothetical protein